MTFTSMFNSFLPPPLPQLTQSTPPLRSNPGSATVMYNMILAPASCTLVHVSYSLILAYKYLFNRSKSTTTKTEPGSMENYRILVFAAILKYTWIQMSASFTTPPVIFEN